MTRPGIAICALARRMFEPGHATSVSGQNNVRAGLYSQAVLSNLRIALFRDCGGKAISLDIHPRAA
jgi:hypothetical protein